LVLLQHRQTIPTRNLTVAVQEQTVPLLKLMTHLQPKTASQMQIPPQQATARTKSQAVPQPPPVLVMVLVRITVQEQGLIIQIPEQVQEREQAVPALAQERVALALAWEQAVQEQERVQERVVLALALEQAVQEQEHQAAEQQHSLNLTQSPARGFCFNNH
jgi:hypothetical protein